MFVKIITVEDSKTFRENVYECTHFGIHPASDEGNGGGAIVYDEDFSLVILEGKTDMTITIENKSHHIYLMNDEGKTIEKYSWCK